MRLLLNEMYPPAVAEQLRARGHDVVAVTERPELRSISDDEVFARAQPERRAVVTENVRDYRPISDGYAARGQAHFGLILVDPGSYPRGTRRTTGRMVTMLDRVLGNHPVDEATSLIHWL